MERGLNHYMGACVCMHYYTHGEFVMRSMHTKADSAHIVREVHILLHLNKFT